MQQLEAIQLVEGANDATRLFGANPRNRYHDFAKVLHPDTVPSGSKLKKRAEAAFKKLGVLYANITKPAIGTAVVIGKWEVKEPFAKGDVADLYRAVEAGKAGTEDVVFKIATAAADNDLLEVEYAHLKILERAKEHASFGKYLPIAKARLEASGRQANILSFGSGYTLADILQFYPRGLDFRHIVWMMNRALSAIGFAHHAGVVHGAVLPEHLVYGPESHGLTLIDWCYSVTGESGKPIPAMVRTRKDFYPTEVARKSPGLPQTDLYMLAATMKSAAAAVPRRFKSVLEHCLAGSPKARPSSAWDLQDRWVELAEAEYGPSRYLLLEIPLV